MSNYFSPPSTCDSPEVIEAARREIDRIAWTREEDQDMAAQLTTARHYLGGYLRALEQFGLIGVDTFNQLQATVEHHLDNVQDAED